MSKFVNIRKEIDEVEDINMTPIMSLFVILIPFLLLAAVFVRINIINSPFPQFSGKTTKKQNTFTLSLYVKKSGFSVVTTGKKKTKFKIKLKDGEYQFDELHRRLVLIKKKAPQEYRLNLYPDSSISYETIVKVMDSTRKITKDDPTIYIKDNKGEKVKQEYLFPDVVWMGVLG